MNNNNINIRKNCANVIRYQRKKLDITQKELAKRIKSSQPTVSFMENANPTISLKKLFDTLDYFGVKYEIIFNSK